MTTEPRKPTFLIIGSAKCGTTALASILDKHPDCCMSRPKEVSFFQEMKNGRPNSNFNKRWEWYMKAFTHYSGEPVVGESTPSYSDRSRSPQTACRIADFNPEMKIIYMVRDPLERQLSTWKMLLAFAQGRRHEGNKEAEWAKEGFESWMKHQRDIDRWDECRYAFQLASYQQVFPEDQLLVTFIENWVSRKEDEVLRILHFLGLDKEHWMEHQRDRKQWDVSRYVFQFEAYREVFAEDQLLVTFLETGKPGRNRKSCGSWSFLDWTREDGTVMQRNMRTAGWSVKSNEIGFVFSGKLLLHWV